MGVQEEEDVLDWECEQLLRGLRRTAGDWKEVVGGQTMAPATGRTTSRPSTASANMLSSGKYVELSIN